MSDRNEPKTLFALEIWLRISSLPEREEEMMDPRYVKDELKVYRVPSERVIGSVSVVELSMPLFGIWRTSVFTFLSTVTVCICGLNFFKWVRDTFLVVLVSPSLPFERMFCPAILPLGFHFAVSGKQR